MSGPDDPAWGFAVSAQVDGFRLRYVRRGAGRPVVALHGWPGCWWDQHRVLGLLQDEFDVVVPDLRGFGGSDRHDVDPRSAYSAEAQAASVLGLLDELGLDRVLLHGYDVGSRVAQAVARTAPERVAALHAGPAVPHGVARQLDLDFEEFEVRVLEDVGRFTPLQAPEAVVDAIRALSSTT